MTEASRDPRPEAIDGLVQALRRLPVEVPDPTVVCDPTPFVIVPIDLFEQATAELDRVRQQLAAVEAHGVQQGETIMEKSLQPAAAVIPAPVVLSRPPLSSPVDLYGDAEFALAWDNDVSYHISRHLLHLRQHREMSQAQVAKAMGSSQSAIARIESGDENVTTDTIQRHVNALGGRFYVVIQPKEYPALAPVLWWEKGDLGAGGPCRVTGASMSDWQPIETAPKPERGRRKVIDVWCVTDDHESAKFYFGNTMCGVKGRKLWQGRVSEVYWLDGAWRPAIGLRLHELTVQPTHWMPLPAPPAPEDQQP